MVSLLVIPSLAADNWKMVVKVKGKVETQFADGAAWAPVYTSRLLTQAQDRVRTLTDSIGRIQTEDGTVVAIGPDTEVTLAQFDMQLGKMKVKMANKNGSLRAKVARFFRGERRFEVETPNAVLAARGTDFLVVYMTEGAMLPIGPVASLPGADFGMGIAQANGSGTTITDVYEGEVGVYSDNQPDPDAVVRPGQRATVRGDQPPVIEPIPADVTFALAGSVGEDLPEIEEGTYTSYYEQTAPTVTTGQQNILLPDAAGGRGNLEILINFGSSPSPSPSPSPISPGI